MAVSLSPSRLDRFADCPRCAWLQVNEGADRPSTPFPSLPEGMDRTIRDHFDCHRRQGTLPPALEGEVDALSEPDPSFVERRRSWWTGPTYVDDELGVVLRGALDDLLRTPEGSLVVLDYETRGHPPTDPRARRVTTSGRSAATRCSSTLPATRRRTTACSCTSTRMPSPATGRSASTPRYGGCPSTLRGPRGAGTGRRDAPRSDPGAQPGCAFCAWNGAEFD